MRGRGVDGFSIRVGGGGGCTFCDPSCLESQRILVATALQTNP